VRVNLRCTYIGMPEKLLNAPEIRTAC
jgi:hypothetical protein